MPEGGVGEVGQEGDARGRHTQGDNGKLTLGTAVDDEGVNVAAGAKAEEDALGAGGEIMREHDMTRAAGPGTA